VNTPYICRELRPTLPNTSTSSADWVTPVIALSCTLSTHCHPILLLILLFTTPSSKIVFFFFLSQKAFYKASIFSLFIYNTPTREVIFSCSSMLVYPSWNSKEVSVWEKPPPTTTFLATIQEDFKHLIRLMYINPFLHHLVVLHLVVLY
jgi:hypothetical protein